MSLVKKEVKYIGRDFGQLSQNLINFAKTYFPDSYRDFNESSPGMMFIEMAAYVGDVLSFYTDQAFKEGNLSKANTFLTRNWEIEGKVQKGRMMGQKIGFPTCNIDIENYVIAKPGVYAVKTRINDRRKFYKGIANLGYRPTFNQKKILLEVNIFNFSGNLYNKKLSVEFLKFIRGEKKFKGISELKNQIKKDILKAKKTQ